MLQYFYARVFPELNAAEKELSSTSDTSDQRAAKSLCSGSRCCFGFFGTAFHCDAAAHQRLHVPAHIIGLVAVLWIEQSVLAHVLQLHSMRETSIQALEQTYTEV